MIGNTDWSFIEGCMNAGDAFNKFYERLYSILDVCKPLYAKRRTKYLPWCSIKIINNIRRKTKRITNIKSSILKPT